MKHLLKKKSSNIGIAFTTKDRPELSSQTIWPLVSDKFDLFWIDGSNTQMGKQLPFGYAREVSNLCEIHSEIRGGPDAAIVYALTELLQRGYEFIGLVENDVILDPDWFDPTFDLFARGYNDGLIVGAVSARNFANRVLIQRDNYSINYSTGAAMILLTREAAQIILRTYRTSYFHEIQHIFMQLSDVDLGPMIGGKQPDTDEAYFSGTTADWFYDAALALHGYCSLACTPCKARNIIDADYVNYRLQDVIAPVDAKRNPEAFDKFRSRLAKLLDNSNSIPALLAPYCYDPLDRKWIIFCHQLSVLFPEAFSGWTLGWINSSGPFIYISKMGAKFTLPVYSGSLNIMLGAGPQGGKAEIITNGISQMYECKVNDFEIISRKERYELHNVEIIAHSDGIFFGGIMIDDLQSWTTTDLNFDYSHLPPVS